HGLADHRVDVYGLGCTLYELLTGRPAIDAVERAEVLRRIAFEEPIALRKLDKAVPGELETIALKCLAKNPNDRYGAAGDLAAARGRLLAQEPIRAKPPTLRQRGTKWARRHRLLVGAAAAVLLLAAAMFGSAVTWVVREQAARRADAERRANAFLQE